MAMLSSTGEIADFREADQFQPAKSQFECGFFVVAMARSMAQVGQPPALTAQQVIVDAELWYAQYDGTDAISNTDGMSLPQLYALLGQVGLHYQAIALDMQVVKAWLKAGYLVIVAITETSVRDLALGVNPYPWNPAGTHVILVTGIASDGNLLVRDSANCTNLYDPNSLRPGPRTYDAAALQLVSATVVVPPWMSRPTSAIAPTTGGTEDMLSITDPFAAAHFQQTGSSPDRWHCPATGQDLFAGILGGWRAMNGAPRLPIGGEVKCGSQAVYQECESGILLYDPAHELDAPQGPWEPCYLLKLDSSLAQKLLLGSTQVTPPALNTTGAVQQLQAIQIAAAAGLKDLGAG